MNALFAFYPVTCYPDMTDELRKLSNCPKPNFLETALGSHWQLEVGVLIGVLIALAVAVVILLHKKRRG